MTDSGTPEQTKIIVDAIGETHDRATIVCDRHGTRGCVVCMVDDFHVWMDERQTMRDQIKRERSEMTAAERYDLGGEA